MSRPRTADNPSQYKQANSARRVSVSADDLPLHCPQPGTGLWNSHPRVFLPIVDAPDGRIICPYCATEYSLSSSG